MKILVIQQKKIGDVLTSSILFEALRKEYPQAELHYLIYPHTSPVMENNPFIDRIIPFNPENQKNLSALWKFVKEIRKQKYDHIIDVYAKINSAFITGFSGAKKRISYQKWYSSNAYTHTFEFREEPKTVAGLAVENRMLLLKAVSEDFPEEIQPKLYLLTSEKELAEEKLKSAGVGADKPLFMIGILGSSSNKTYPLHYMTRVLDFITSKTGADLLFNYLPQQEQQAKELFLKCNVKTRECIHFQIYGKSLREFMALTSCCDAFIGNEGGAANMAKALGIPTFSIFSPQIKKVNWSLYEDGKKHVSVHLEDFQPQLFKFCSRRYSRKLNVSLYKKLKPELIKLKLSNFLKNLDLGTMGY